MTKNILITFLISIGSLQTIAQLNTPLEVIEEQLVTYNNRDLEGFMALFDDSVSLYNQANGERLASGKAEVKALYKNLFEKSPKLHSELKNRMVLGNTVIDHEYITGRMGSAEPIELIVIYELTDLKISKVTVIR